MPFSILATENADKALTVHIKYRNEFPNPFTLMIFCASQLNISYRLQGCYCQE